MSEFTGLVAIVTGGASGIGAATARLLHERGANVTVLDRQSGDDAGIAYELADVTDDSAVREVIDRVAENHGRIDIVVNNAGIGSIGDIAADDDAEWNRIWDINVMGMVRVSRAALPHLRKSSHAVIVNTSSAVAILGVRNRAAYAATKGAVYALTLAMAADHVGDGIRVNAVAPGTTETPWINRLLAAADDPEAAAENLRARQPLGRLVTAEEVAYAIASLASPQAASTTGSVLSIDGGMTTLRV